MSEVGRQRSEIRGQRSVDTSSKFKVQSLKLKLNLKGFYRLLFTAYRLPIPFTDQDWNDFYGF
jgi:hypothetical protein